MSEVVMVPGGFHRLLELRSGEVAQAVDLVLHCHGKDFGMLDDVHRRRR